MARLSAVAPCSRGLPRGQEDAAQIDGQDAIPLLRFVVHPRFDDVDAGVADKRVQPTESLERCSNKSLSYIWTADVAGAGRYPTIPRPPWPALRRRLRFPGDRARRRLPEPMLEEMACDGKADAATAAGDDCDHLGKIVEVTH